ncbi:MAG TPA: hypothetical protein VKE40_12085 [Gemmataceae bacterium]|nr:hypothetical protein [Gemmataceae bacterium]
MDDFVSLAELAAELGLDRSHTRDCVRRSGIRPRKIRCPGSVTRYTLVLTHEEAECIRAAQCRGSDDSTPDCGPGCFVVVRLVPDLDPRRIKVGFAHDVRARLAYLQMAAPTAALVKCWPCKQSWVGTVIDCVIAVGCTRISADVFECDDVNALVQRAGQLFSLLPTPRQDLPLSFPHFTMRDAVCDHPYGPGRRRGKR